MIYNHNEVMKGNWRGRGGGKEVVRAKEDLEL